MQSKNMRFPALFLATALLAAGCSVPTRFTAENFDIPPGSWGSIEPTGTAAPASLSLLDGGESIPDSHAAVQMGRLLLGGKRFFRDELPFQEFRGFSDFMVSGGVLAGSAGIFVEVVQPGRSRNSLYTLAINGRGEWKAYRGFPGRPLKQDPWQPFQGQNPTIPVRLGAEYRNGENGGEIRFQIDGHQVAAFDISDPPSGAVRQEGANPAEPETPNSWRHVGVFSNHLSVAVDNFIFGEDRPDGPFRPEDHIQGSGAAQGRRLLEEAERRREDFQKRPTRPLLLGVIEAYTAAERAFRDSGDSARANQVAREAVQSLLSLEDAAKRARSLDLLRLMTRGRSPSAREALVEKQGQEYAARARNAESEGRPLEALIFWMACGEVTRSDEAQREAERLVGALDPPLTYDYRAREETKPATAFPRQMFFAPAREIYGALQKVKGGEIQIDVLVKEARLDRQQEESSRRVALLVSESPMSPELSAELGRLEKRFPEDISDAEARGRLRQLVDLTGKVDISRVKLDGRMVEVLVSDVKELKDTEARLEELRAKRDAERKAAEKWVSVPAMLHTDSGRVRLEYRLAFAGKVEIADTIQVYEGMEQWSHAADPSRGIPEARYSEEALIQLINSIRKRAVSRFRTGIARERILQKLSPDEGTRFILRFARSTRDESDRAMAAWRLKSLYKLEGFTLKGVLERILESATGVSTSRQCGDPGTGELPPAGAS